MRWVAAPLAAAVAVVALAACGEGGAEPGASDEATLVLDFSPNAVHSGLYLALAEGEFERRGIELEIRQPAASTDAPKLLESGRADFAILDIHDLALARERGLDLVGLGAIARRPLASVIAADREAVRSPADLEGAEVGVTGLPSDEAVLDTVLRSAGLSSDSVGRVTIGFDTVAVLAAGRLDAATAFWNAEGVALRRLGVPTREFRVDEFGAPPYPELVLATSGDTLDRRPELVTDVLAAADSGYAAVLAEPDAGVAALLDAVPELSEPEQSAQLESLIDGGALGPDTELDREALARWARWARARGIVTEPIDLNAAFPQTR